MDPWFSLVRLIVLVIALYFFARWFLGFRIGAPYIPVRKRDLDDAIALANLSASDVVVDLGSGDGRVLVAAAEKGARVIGYEINPFLCWIARRRLKRFGDRAQVFCKNLLEADLSQATVVFVFGITDLMPKIAELLKKQRRSIALYSVAFELPGYEPVEERGVVKKYLITG